MLSNTCGIHRRGSIAELLSETGPGARANASPSFGEQFSSALARSLNEVGISPNQVQVTVQKAARPPSEAGPREHRFLVTFQAPLAAVESSEDSAGAAGASTSEVPPYDPALGPRITRDMWTPEMLTGELAAEFLRNVVNPADFMNARLAAVQKPTNACIKDASGGASQPLNPSILSTREQAEAMADRLANLGINAGDIEEVTPATGPFSIDYAGDDRRCFHIGVMNVGALVERYAKYPVEFADTLTLGEWNGREAA